MEEYQLSREDLSDMLAGAAIYKEAGFNEVRIDLDHAIEILTRLLEDE